MASREARFHVRAAPEELWRFLRDFETLCACIPGVERVHVVDDCTAELQVKEKIGVIPLIVNLRAEIVEETPPEHLGAVATGEHVTMHMDVVLEPVDGGTALRTVFDVIGTGPLKPVVKRLFDKKAAERTAQFADTLAARFGGPQAP